MARCSSSWLLELRKPRGGTRQPELTFRACSFKCWRKAGEKFLCKVRAWSELFQRSVLTSAWQNSSLKSLRSFTLSSVGLLPLLLLGICLTSCEDHLNKIKIRRWKMALSLMGHAQVRRWRITPYRIQAGLWQGPSLIGRVRAGAGHWVLHSPGTIQHLVHGRRSVHKLNWTWLSHPQFGLLFTVNSSSNMRTACWALSHTV